MEVRRFIAGDEEDACRLVEAVKFEMDDIRDVSLASADLAPLVGEENAYLLGAYVDGAPVGMAYGYCFPRLDGPRPMMFVYEVGVLADHRRQGIGRALMEEMKRLAQARNCTKMFVPTEATNEAACALYRAAGGEGGPDPNAATFWWKW